MKAEHFDDLDLSLAASSFAALGSEQRLAVLRCLVRAGPEGLSIGALGARSGITGSTLTHHLRILAQAGLVRQTRQGRSVICAAVAYEEVKALSAFLLKSCCVEAGEACDAHGAEAGTTPAAGEVPHD